MNKRNFLMAGAAVMAAPWVRARQAWPSAPIRLIIPFSPGGGTDTVGRLIAKQMQDRLKVTVFVENRAGASGTIGMSALARCEPDGYTLGLVPSGPLDVSPTLAGVPYDPAKDFSFIGPVAMTPLFMCVSKKLGANSMAELIAKAKAKPNEVKYSSGGVGNSSHLAGALLASMTDTTLLHVPYKGAGPATLAVISGEVDILFGSGQVRAQVEAGKVLNFGVSELKRLPNMPGLKTVAEQGVPGFEATSWSGIVGPTGIPPDIAQRLTAALKEIMEEPAFRKVLLDLLFLPVSGTGQDLQATVDRDRLKWGALIQKLGIKGDS